MKPKYSIIFIIIFLAFVFNCESQKTVHNNNVYILKSTIVEKGKSSITNTNNGTYKPDNNPVTYDENPDNYPLEKPHTYENIYNNEVQAPTHYKSIPSGACAICRDSSYSFSQNRRGTCSRHGGVARWLR